MDGGSPDSFPGLSEQDAAARLKAEGPNTLPQADRRTFGRIVLEILREPMFALLLGAAASISFSAILKKLSCSPCLRAPRFLSPWCGNPAPNGCSRACGI